MTVEASMMNPISALHTSFFHSNIIYAGSAAGHTLNDILMMDSANLDHASVLALSASAFTTAPPELAPHRIGALVNKIYMERWKRIQVCVLVAVVTLVLVVAVLLTTLNSHSPPPQHPFLILSPSSPSLSPPLSPSLSLSS